MRRYETIFISDPDLSEPERDQVLQKTKTLISKFNGVPILFEDWGSKKLAYSIKKKNRGYYVRIDYCGNGDLVDEMERSFRIDDRVLKFMTIVLEKDADPEQLKKDLVKEESVKTEDQQENVTADAETKAGPSEAETEKEAEKGAEPVAETKAKTEEPAEETTEKQTIEEE